MTKPVKDVIKNDFISLVNTYNSTTILLFTSAQPKKKEFLSALSNEFKTVSYKTDEVLSSSLIFKGNLAIVNSFRKLLYKKQKFHHLQEKQVGQTAVL